MVLFSLKQAKNYGTDPDEMLFGPENDYTMTLKIETASIWRINDEENTENS